jgi:hypothetical protein
LECAHALLLIAENLHTLLLVFCLQFKLLSNDVFDQFRVNGVLDPAIDVEFNALHPGEGMMQASTQYY